MSTPKTTIPEENSIPKKDVYNFFLEEMKDDKMFESCKEFVDEEVLGKEIEKCYDYYNSRQRIPLQEELNDLINKSNKQDEDELFKLDEDVSMCFIVDNLPKSKHASVLEGRFRKRISGLLKINDENIINVHFPMELKKQKKKDSKKKKDSMMTTGMAFFELIGLERQKNNKQYVCTKIQSKPMVKKYPNKYVMKIYSLKDMSIYDNYDFSKLETPQVAQKFHPEKNYLNYLCEKDGREQILVRDGKSVGIYWFDGMNENLENIVTFEDDYFLADEVRWSPIGTYLVAYNKKKETFELYGSIGASKFDLLKEICIHGELDPKSARLIGSQSFSFTPFETFFCVHSQENNEKIYLIYDLRTCSIAHKLKYNEAKKGSFVIQWACNDHYLSIMNKGKITIYETSTFTEIGKLKEKGICGLQWSPTESSLVYYTQEVEEVHSSKNVVDSESLDPYSEEYDYNLRQKQKQTQQQRNIQMVLFYISLPSFKLIKSKVFHNPYSLNIHFHSSGNYFAAVVEDRKFKKDKLVSVISSIDLYRLKEKGLPVDNFIVHQKIDNFYWEPTTIGSKFLMITSTPSTELVLDEQQMQYHNRFQDMKPTGKPSTKSMFLYKIEESQTRLIKKQELSNKDSTFISWSPEGRFFILGSIASDHKSNYHFFDTGGSSLFLRDEKKSCFEETGKVEHFAITTSSWDPSGRFFLAGTTRSGSITENNGFVISDISGKYIMEKKYLKCYQVLWRNKPKNLLSSKKLKKLQSPSNTRKFAKLEKQKENSRRKDIEDKYKKIFDDFQNYRKQIVDMISPRMRKIKEEYIDLKEEIDVTLDEKIELL